MEKTSPQRPEYDVVVIGSGFGGAMTSLRIARAFKDRALDETVHILERGTWWTTPVGTVADPQVQTFDYLRQKKQPVQFWSSRNDFRGAIDLFTRCLRRWSNKRGLYDLTNFGKRGFLGLLKTDGVTIVRANGVGGGSLVYSNITIQPPDFVIDAWGTGWNDTRQEDFQLARDAIGLGVLHALDIKDGRANPVGAVNAGLSNIVTRSARLNPGWAVQSASGVKQIIDPASKNIKKQFDPQNSLWIDRARVFQSSMAKLTNEFGTVDSSINDQPPEWTAQPGAPVPPEKVTNYCERQGRCNLGCLPGARHTLNKQLMSAILGTPELPGKPAQPRTLPNLTLEALAEVDIIRPLRVGAGYEIVYRSSDPNKNARNIINAKRVILAAGCVGTTQLMLRCWARKTLHLSPRLGEHFSTNGDYIAFLEKANTRIGLTRGPVTTSFAHFNTTDNQTQFHTIEDQGVPPPLASTLGLGIPLIRSLSRQRSHLLFRVWVLLLWVLSRAWHFLLALFKNVEVRQEEFMTPEERFATMMCVVGMGRESSTGKFELGRRYLGDTELRLKRTSGGRFHRDPIYRTIQNSIDEFGKQIGASGENQFRDPFFSQFYESVFGRKTVAVSHPLGGCPIGKDAASGVVDEFGRVFDPHPLDPASPFHPGLYIADAAIIPTALGVNPSLTISALALRCAAKLIEELPSRPTSHRPG